MSEDQAKSHLCEHPGCGTRLYTPGVQFCFEHMPATAQPERREGENSGGHVNYYSVLIEEPNKPQQQPTPYMAECEDIIEALGMNFAEASAFKAIWRRCAERALGLKKAGNSAKRDAEKVVYYGGRMLAQDKRELRKKAAK